MGKTQPVVRRWYAQTELFGLDSYYSKPPLGQCVLSVLSFGGGVNSAVLLEWALSGDLQVDVVLFADTGNNSQATASYVAASQERCKAAGLPFVIVSHGNMLKDFMAPEGRFVSLPLNYVIPGKRISRLRRQCTQEYKQRPIEDFLLSYLLSHDYATLNTRGQRRVKRGFYIRQYIGFTLDESRRVRVDRRHWVHLTYPLIEHGFCRETCIDWLFANERFVPSPSRCIICPYRREWPGELSPDEMVSAIEFDEWLRERGADRVTKGMKGTLYLHYSGKPLRAIMGH
jgi:hypothetical protein